MAERWGAADGLVPAWLARGLVLILALVVGFGGVGLVLAIVGWCQPIVVVPLGAAASVTLARLGWDAGSDRGDARHTAWAVAAIALAVVSGIVNGARAGEHVVVNRDPGVYLVTGRWVAEHGTLLVDARPGPFTARDVAVESHGGYEAADGRVQFQFNHLLPVLLAEAHWLGGDRSMVLLPVLLGAAALVSTFALATRLTRRSWAGFLATTTVAVSLPMLAATRDTYSEPAVWLLLTGGLWLFIRAADDHRPGLGLLSGTILGAIAAARIDAVVYLLPLPIVAGLVGRGQLARVVRAALIGVCPGLLLGMLDLLLRSRSYLTDLRAQVIPLWVGFALAMGIGGVLRATSGRHEPARWRRRPQVRTIRWLAAGAAVATVVVGMLAWFVRPDVQVARSGSAFAYIGDIQVAEGQAFEPDRRYDERSLEWMAWYLGPPTVAFAIIGAALVVHRSVRRWTPDGALFAWAVLGGGTLVTLWRPAITPDHIWASRRFVPAAIPLIAILAGVTVATSVDLVRRVGRRTPAAGRLAPAVGWVMAALIVVPVVDRTRPVADFSDQPGYLDVARDACAAVRGGAVLAIDGERAGLTLPLTLRAFCDVPVGLLAPDATPQRVGELAAAWAAEDGRPTYLISADVADLARLAPGAPRADLGPYASHQVLEVTVTRPPRRLLDAVDTFYVARVEGQPTP